MYIYCSSASVCVCVLEHYSQPFFCVPTLHRIFYVCWIFCPFKWHTVNKTISCMHYIVECTLVTRTQKHTSTFVHSRRLHSLHVKFLRLISFVEHWKWIKKDVNWLPGSVRLARFLSLPFSMLIHSLSISQPNVYSLCETSSLLHPLCHIFFHSIARYFHQTRLICIMDCVVCLFVFIFIQVLLQFHRFVQPPFVFSTFSIISFRSFSSRSCAIINKFFL